MSVIAIAAAAAGLHHAIVQAHAVQGIITFVMAFFAIWCVWMNDTWFASAYNNDDTIFRLLTIVIMGGSLTIAAGIAVLTALSVVVRSAMVGRETQSLV